MRTDLNLITNTTDGTKKTNKLSYVNPDANDGTLTTLANKIADLSNDTLTGATKTDTTDIPINATPIRVEFYNTADPTTVTINLNDIDGTYGKSIVVYDQNGDEIPIMVPNLQPYIKENNTRVEVSIFKDTSEGQWAYAGIALAATPATGTDDKSDPSNLTPKLTGDIVIGTKILSGNYINILPDLVMHIVRT